MGVVNEFDMQRLSVILESKGCKRPENVVWMGRRRRGWLGVRLRDADLNLEDLKRTVVGCKG
jgi:hypothetical protein